MKEEYFNFILGVVILVAVAIITVIGIGWKQLNKLRAFGWKARRRKHQLLAFKISQKNWWMISWLDRKMLSVYLKVSALPATVKGPDHKEERRRHTGHFWLVESLKPAAVWLLAFLDSTCFESFLHQLSLRYLAICLTGVQNVWLAFLAVVRRVSRIGFWFNRADLIKIFGKLSRSGEDFP